MCAAAVASRGFTHHLLRSAHDDREAAEVVSLGISTPKQVALITHPEVGQRPVTVRAAHRRLGATRGATPEEAPLVRSRSIRCLVATDADFAVGGIASRLALYA